MIRPEVLALLSRGREVLMATAAVLAGVWLWALGGWLMQALGGLAVVLGLGWGVTALRRMRFSVPGDGPGVVEVDEGRISYFGPMVGGSVGLPDLVDLRLVTLRGRRLWRLRQADGQTILIPVEAAGADRLFDAFASLPGMDTSALVGALGTASGPVSSGGPGGQLVGTGDAAVLEAAVVVWRRAGRGLVRDSA